MEEVLDKFLNHAFTEFFPTITTVILKILENYNKHLNEDGSLQKATAYLKNKNMISSAVEVATRLVSETSIEPAQMQHFIDEHITLASSKINTNTNNNDGN